PARRGAAGPSAPARPSRRRRRSGRRAARTAGGSPAVQAASHSFAAHVTPPVLPECLRLRRKIREDELDESQLRREAERRIEAPLEPDRRAGFATEPFATRRAPEVRGEDFDVVGELQKLVVDAVVEQFGESGFRTFAEEIRSSPPAGEEGIP